jgi:hypothetical protein
MEAAEELTGPLGSCILENKTYRITELPLQIEGHVVIPAGTRLIAPYDPNHPVIEVLPGGLLDTGKAAFYTEEEYPDILPPVEIVPEDPNIQFYHNNVGIYVHRGADRKTRIENIIIENCIAGLVIDEALDYPLRQVITVGCYDGVQVYAPAGITDCLFWYNGSVYYDIFGYPGTGIYVWMDWEGDTPDVAIDRTTVYSADVALYIEGGIDDPNATDPNHVVPSVRVINSCLTGSGFFGVYQSPGEAMIDVRYCGFGGNYSNTNIDLPLTGCLELADIPFYNRPEDWKKLYIKPGSWLIDGGYGMATDGTGVGHDRPDTGVMDIGCHYSLGLSGGFGIQSSPADFNWDGVVDELDLALMDMCMGAVTDPNIVRLDGNYDSRVNLPDFGLFATDYGYCGDPNFCTNTDPNCTRSDFNGDDWVDIEDLAILAEQWLAVVFDEYRLCSLCNLYTGMDPNDPNAPAGCEVIDANDMAAFMAEWGTLYSSDPNIMIEPSVSRLSVAVGNPAPAWKISAFLDEELVGEWEEGGLGSTAFDADLTRYGPGSHRLKIVRNINYGLEITEQIITDPNSIGLYFADIPDTFEPNEPYCIRGFNLGDELNITINDIWENPIYDVNVPYGEIDLDISSEVFGETVIATFLAFSATTPDDEDRYEKVLKRTFDPNSVRDKYIRMVILLPDSKVTKTFKPAIYAAMKACERRSVAGYTAVLTDYDVTCKNLDFLFWNTQGRKTLVYFGHANSHVQNIQRTRFQCYTLSKKYDPGKYYDVGAVSYTIYSMGSAPPLSSITVGNQSIPMDDIVYDIRRVTRSAPNSQYYPPIDQMYVFGCLSAAYNDMAHEQGCGGDHDQSAHDMLYMGFTKEVIQNPSNVIPGMKKLTTLVVQGLTVFFDALGEGKTVQQAVGIVQQEDKGIRQALFGVNGSLDNTQGGLERAYEDDDALTVYGLGYVGGVRFGHNWQ